MSAVATPTPRLAPAPTASFGPLGRLGRWTATHFRAVLGVWLVIAVGLGFFAPKVETALSGAGWEASGSQSVQARKLVERDFKGARQLRPHDGRLLAPRNGQRPRLQGGGREASNGLLRENAAVSTVVAPAPGISISRDGHTAIVQAGAAKNPNEMVAAADKLKGKLHALSTSSAVVDLTGAPGMWSDFNAANRSAMLKSEVISWPVTLGIMLLAFGSLVAAGLPLMLTMVGLRRGRRRALPRHSDLADLDLGDELRADVRARARHRLRPVHRLPLPRRSVRLANGPRGGRPP